MNAANPIREAASLASDAVAKAADLVLLEVRLARTELNEKAIAWKAGAGLILFSAIFAIGAVVILLQAALAELVAAGVSPPTAILVVAGSSLIIAIGFFLGGRSLLRAETLMPNRTLHQLSRDRAMVKEKLT